MSRRECSAFVCTSPVPSCSFVDPSFGTSVSQEDLFIPTLTPREHLRFHADLRMSMSITREEKMAAVERAVETLGLGKRSSFGNLSLFDPTLVNLPHTLGSKRWC